MKAVLGGQSVAQPVGPTPAPPVFDGRAMDVRLGTAGQVLALRQVDLRIAPGERVALVGANGSGKSTLLRTLHGLLPLSAGALQACPPAQQAMLFQRPFVLRLSALWNVRLALCLRGTPWRATRAPALAALERVGLAALAGRNARALSGGQQQRLALARAWAQRPAVWLLDEPTASLDPHAKQEVEGLIAEFATAPGATLVFSSHHLGQVKRLATRVVYLEGGCLRADLPAHDFFNETVLAQVCPTALAFCKGDL